MLAPATMFVLVQRPSKATERWRMRRRPHELASVVGGPARPARCQHRTTLITWCDAGLAAPASSASRGPFMASQLVMEGSLTVRTTPGVLWLAGRVAGVAVAWRPCGGRRLSQRFACPPRRRCWLSPFRGYGGCSACASTDCCLAVGRLRRLPLGVAAVFRSSVVRRPWGPSPLSSSLATRFARLTSMTLT